MTTVFATPSLGLIKTSLFIQYHLLFWPLRYVRITVYIGATISTLYYTAVTIASFVLQSPWPGENLLEGVLSWHYQGFIVFSLPTGIIGMLIDWGLFFIPLPAVYNLNLSLAKKIGVMLVFMTGGLYVVYLDTLFKDQHTEFMP